MAEQDLATREAEHLLPAEINPFEDVGSELRRAIVGSLLRFSKGDYLYGQNNAELPLGTKVIANMDQCLRGYIRWEDNKPAEQVMGLVAEGYKPPARSALGWLDKNEWEVDDKGQPRDPWQETWYLLMRQVDKEGKPFADDGLYTFTTGSVGGTDAVKELCSTYGKWMRMKPNQYPIITLAMGKYPHSNKSYGIIKKPIFLWSPKSSDCWIAKDQFGEISAAAGDDEADIPF